MDYLKMAFKTRPVARPVTHKPTRVERIDMIKKHEALRLVAYLPTPHDVWTIGWGHTATARAGMKITKVQAETLLRRDLAWVRDVIAKRVKVPLTQPQYDALASFIFNLGEANFKASTLLKKLNAYDYVGTADQFPRWNKQRQGYQLVVLRGLTKRRAEERALFLEGTL
jgi:GH24 family phage-related lysozyme (muramidase)